MNKYSNDIEAFMTKDNLDGVIRYLKMLPEIGAEAKSKLLVLQGRLTKLESDRSVGILSQDDYSKERNQIRFGIIQESAKLESKINQKEEIKVKRKKTLLTLKKYGLRALTIFIALFLIIKCFGYYSFVKNVNIPFKYIGTPVTMENIHDLNKIIEGDSTLGNKNFNHVMKFLSTSSRGPRQYVELNDYDTSYINNLVDTVEFANRTNSFYKDLSDNDITFDKIYLELDYEAKLREEILYDTIQNKYKVIDKMCIEIQDAIDKKLKIAENIKKQVKVELFNVEINKTSKNIEARSKIRNGTGLTLYYVKARIHICNFMFDTLTNIVVSVDQPEGIDAIYKQSLDYFSFWDQPSIYNSIKNYKKRDLIFREEILEANVEGENYNLRYYRPENLPYGATYYSNWRYNTKKELNGYCQYLGYDNKEVENTRNSVKNLIIGELKKKEFHFGEIYKHLSFSK